MHPHPDSSLPHPHPNPTPNPLTRTVSLILTLTLTLTLTRGLSARSSAAGIEASRSRGRRQSYAERLKGLSGGRLSGGDGTADGSDKERLGQMGAGRPAGVSSMSLIDRVSQVGQHAGAAASLALLRELLTTHQQWTSVLLDSEHEVGSVLIRIIRFIIKLNQ